MKNQLGKSKWVTGLLVTLVMTMFMALPVMAKEYTFSFKGNTFYESVPDVLYSGDVLTCEESTYVGAYKNSDTSVKLFVEVEYQTDKDTYLREKEDKRTNRIVLESFDGVSKWSVVGRQGMVFTEDDRKLNPSDKDWAAVKFFLCPYKEDIEREEQNVELPDGRQGKEYSAAWVDFGDDKNIVVEKFAWNGSANISGLHFGYDSDYLPLNVDGNKIFLSGTPKKTGEFDLPLSIEVWYKSDKYPNGHKILCKFGKPIKILDENGNEKYDIEWNNECKKGTVDEYYDTAYWVFYKLDKLPGYKSTACSIKKVLDLPDGVDVVTGADPRNDGMMGLRFKGTPSSAGTWHPVVYGFVTYSNDEGKDRRLSFKWQFKINIEGDDDDDDDDDDDHDEPAPSNANNNNAGGASQSASAASTGSTVAFTPEQKAQAATAQLSAAQTTIASVPTLLATNSALYSRTGMPLDMTSVNTLDANTVNLLSTNNKIPYNVTITFAGNPFTVKIPAGFNYKSFVKADGSVNIHEVLWAILSGQKR